MFCGPVFRFELFIIFIEENENKNQKLLGSMKSTFSMFANLRLLTYVNVALSYVNIV